MHTHCFVPSTSPLNPHPPCLSQPKGDGVCTGCSACVKKPKVRCDFIGNAFQPGNSVCLQLFTANVRFRHAWPGTHEQLLDEEFWQLSFSDQGRSQWELTAGNVIATLSYYANAASANTGWIACPQWLPFRLESAVKRISCNALYVFYRFCGSEL